MQNKHAEKEQADESLRAGCGPKHLVLFFIASPRLQCSNPIDQKLFFPPLMSGKNLLNPSASAHTGQNNPAAASLRTPASPRSLLRPLWDWASERLHLLHPCTSRARLAAGTLGRLRTVEREQQRQKRALFPGSASRAPEHLVNRHCGLCVWGGRRCGAWRGDVCAQPGGC